MNHCLSSKVQRLKLKSMEESIDLSLTNVYEEFLDDSIPFCRNNNDRE